jgi:hypothetical protein
MSDNDDLKAQLEALRAENEALRAAKSAPKALSIKVSEKGGVSVYGLGRFPVTLYKSQWDRLIAHIPEVTSFMAANASKLTEKEPVTPAVKA